MSLCPTDSSLFKGVNWFRFNLRWFRSTFNDWNGRNWTSSSSIGGSDVNIFVSTNFCSNACIDELVEIKPRQHQRMVRRHLIKAEKETTYHSSGCLVRGVGNSTTELVWTTDQERSKMSNQSIQVQNHGERIDLHTGNSIWSRRLLPASQSQNTFIAESKCSFSSSSMINLVLWWRAFLRTKTNQGWCSAMSYTFLLVIVKLFLLISGRIVHDGLQLELSQFLFDLCGCQCIAILFKSYDSLVVHSDSEEKKIYGCTWWHIDFFLANENRSERLIMAVQRQRVRIIRRWILIGKQWWCTIIGGKSGEQMSR